MFRSFRTLAGIPLLPVLLPLSLLARIHLSALPIALAFLLTGWAGSYTAVGVVSAFIALGQAVAGPVRGRIADRGSASRLLFTSGAGYAVGLLALILATLFLPASCWPVTTVISFCTGLAMPPISQIARALWSRLGDGGSKRALYTIDATGYEIVSVLGPLLSAGAVSLAGGVFATALCAVLATGGAVSFGLVLRVAGLDRNQAEPAAPDVEPMSSTRQPSLLRDPRFVRAVLVPFFLMTALFATDLSVVAWARDRGAPGLAGLLDAILAAGSLVGGAIAVSRGGNPRGVLTITGMALALGVVSVLLPPVQGNTPVWLLVVVLLLAGTTLAPSASASYARVGEVAPPHRQAEAFGWLATATTCGAGVALPVVGWLLDRVGPAAGGAAGVIAVLVAAALVLSLPKPAAEPATVTSETS
jgi:MFS family permease